MGLVIRSGPPLTVTDTVMELQETLYVKFNPNFDLFSLPPSNSGLSKSVGTAMDFAQSNMMR
jgi:hypothetical protein